MIRLEDKSVRGLANIAVKLNVNMALASNKTLLCFPLRGWSLLLAASPLLVTLTHIISVPFRNINRHIALNNRLAPQPRMQLKICRLFHPV